MNLPDAITELGRQTGLPGLALNDSGLCRVVFDGTLTVDFEARQDGRTLHLCSVVAPLDPAAQGEAYYETLLQANLLGIATGGAHFSVNTMDEEVLFERVLDMEALDYLGFSMAVESFVNHLEGWREKLASLPPAAPAVAVTMDSSFAQTFQFRA